uniref:Serpentine receptor class gamma n=1 Tax=Caenorhabditis tropicalis TaxID=1561998 RepID=A0A1I7T5C8_9PELO
MNSSFEGPILIKCDTSYDWKIECVKFVLQYLFLVPGLILNTLILKTIWLKYPKIYRPYSFFVIYSLDLMVNIVLILTGGLMARLFIYLTPLCELLSEYFSTPLIGFKLVMILVHHSIICKSIVQTLIVLNRMTCVLFPVKHDFIWRKDILKWLLPTVLVFPLTVDWNIAISRVYMRSTYGGFWVDYIKTVSWAGQSKFQLAFILFALTATVICTLITLSRLGKLQQRAKNLEKSISKATLIISIGFSCTAAFQIYYGFFFVYTTGSAPMFGLNFLSVDFLTVGSPIVILCASSSLRKHVIGREKHSQISSIMKARSRTN